MRSLEPGLADALAAVLRRIIPTDEHGPGAEEAGVLNFIDSELSSRLRHLQADYVAGLAELEARARRTYGRSFTALPPDDQDGLLRTIESGDGVPQPLSRWFGLVVEDCLDGYLSDPAHGGNRDFVGWKVVGYPGPSMVWTEEEQRLDRPVPFRGSSLVTLTLTKAPHHD